MLEVVEDEQTSMNGSELERVDSFEVEGIGTSGGGTREGEMSIDDEEGGRGSAKEAILVSRCCPSSTALTSVIFGRLTMRCSSAESSSLRTGSSHSAFVDHSGSVRTVDALLALNVAI